MPLSLSPSLLMSSASSVAFSPLSLFASGEQGAWYDPSDLTTMFQDTAGTTPVTATGQTVGLLLDKSKGLVLGPELVTNGDFSSGTTGWTTQGSTTISAVSGAMVVNQPVAGTWFSENVRLVTPVLTIGKFYKIEFDARNTSGTNSLRLANNATVILDMPTINATFQRFTAIFQCTVTNTFTFFKNGLTGTFELDNISVKELPGNHATQATAASRPIYGIEPFGGRRNLLTYTEQFDNAAWTKLNATITANNAAAPDGTMTADLVVSTGGETRVGVNPGVVAANTTYTASVFGKFSNANGRYLWFRDFYAGRSVGFDLQTGVVTQADAGITGVVSVSTDGYFRCVATWTTPASPVVANQQYWVQSPSGTNVSAGTAGGQCLIWGAQLELGSTATAYQRVTDQWNVTQAGVPSVSYIQCDGTDDFLLTGTITPGIDKAQVFAGVRKLSDAAQGIVVESSTSSLANSGAFMLRAPAGANATYGWFSWGAAGVGGTATTSASYTSPITNVLTGLGDIAGDVATLRVNGTQVATSAADQGTGNYLAYPLYIGRRAGTTLPFNGRIYQMLVRFGANLSAATITQTETFVNSRTGAY